jgi:hypothetical protein
VIHEQKCLLAHELDKRYDLRKSLDITAFFERLRTLSPNTIPLTEEATKVRQCAVERVSDHAESSVGASLVAPHM